MTLATPLRLLIPCLLLLLGGCATTLPGGRTPTPTEPAAPAAPTSEPLPLPPEPPAPSQAPIADAAPAAEPVAAPSAPVPIPAPAPPPKPAPAPAPLAPPQPAPAPAPKPAAAPATFSIQGQLSLQPSRGAEVSPEEAGEAVVYFIPDQPASKPVAVRREVATRGKRFSPTTLVVPVGSTVVFPNQDQVLHNVFSLSPGNEFDLDLYGPGETREVRLANPAIVRVHCNVHHSMQTDVVVVDTPYYTQVGADGRFEIKGLPPGPGALHVWHARAQPSASRLELPLAKPLSLALVATKPRVPPHTNKDGDSYRAALER